MSSVPEDCRDPNAADTRLTLRVYTHVELHDQTVAMEALPAPPGAGKGRKSV